MKRISITIELKRKIIFLLQLRRVEIFLNFYFENNLTPFNDLEVKITKKIVEKSQDKKLKNNLI